jgi:hypothetical protein
MDLEVFSNCAKCRSDFSGWRRRVRTFLEGARGVWIEMLQDKLKLEGMAGLCLE